MKVLKKTVSFAHHSMTDVFLLFGDHSLTHEDAVKTTVETNTEKQPDQEEVNKSSKNPSGRERKGFF